MVPMYEERFLNVSTREQLRRLHIKNPTDIQLAVMRDILSHVWLRRTVHADTRLTTREKQCLHYITMGKSVREIAEYMNVKEITVKYFRQAILEKLSCKTMEEAVAKGIRYGELPKYRTDLYGNIIDKELDAESYPT